MATYEFRIRNRMERFTYAEKVEADSLVEAIWLLRSKTIGWSYHYIMSATLYHEKTHVTESFFNYPQFSDYTHKGILKCGYADVLWAARDYVAHLKKLAGGGAPVKGHKNYTQYIKELEGYTNQLKF